MDLLERLRSRGWRLTPQRRAVAEVLRGEHVHLSAEVVHEQARRRLPEISLATVYNTLNELVAMGEVIEVTAGEGAKRYDPNVGVRHQHLHCVRCNELLDVRPVGERSLRLPAAQRHGYEIIDMEIVFRGLCPDCRRRADESAEGASAP
jgi:Fe2+ or Zn2+ uptake regulation protein